MIMSGVSSGWVEGLTNGTGEYLVSLAMCTLGYVCLALCTAEMVGIVPFSGGSYGYARCTLSPLVGFMVGICDLLQSVYFTAFFVDVVAVALAIATTSDHSQDYMPWLPMWYIVVYAIILSITIFGGRSFWSMMGCFTTVTVVCLVFYGLMSIGQLDFGRFVSSMQYPMFKGTGHQFFAEMMMPTVCFVGIDLLTLFSDETIDAKTTLPKAILTTIAITCVTTWWITISIVAQAPGVTADLVDAAGSGAYPMHFGFENVFHCSSSVGHYIMAPLTLSSALGFLFASGRQMRSMSLSHLLPHFLQDDAASFWYNYLDCSTGLQPVSRSEGSSATSTNRILKMGKTPTVALIVSSLAGLLGLLLVWGLSGHSSILYQLSMIGAYCVYLSIFSCYLAFQYRYSSMKRTFTNPLGVVSAVIGILYFGLGLISLLFVRGDFAGILVFLPTLLVFVVYYYFVAQHKQFFSEEEQEMFLKAYIVNGECTLFVIILNLTIC
jgi:ethanolamine permease